MRDTLPFLIALTGIAIAVGSVPADAQSGFKAGIRQAREQCLQRQGHFWHTDKGYGCNQAVAGGDFNCKQGTCTPVQAQREPGNFGGAQGSGGARGAGPGRLR